MLRECAGIHKSRATKFCTVTPNICWSSVWNLPRITLLAPAIWSGSPVCRKFVYPCLHVYIAEAVWLPVAVPLKTCISEVPGSNLGRPSAVLTGLSWFFVSFFWANAGILYRLCRDCLPPRAGSGSGENIFHPPSRPSPNRGGPAKNLYTIGKTVSCRVT